ncbi:hypothetical protein DCO58_05515 [Helicobacter saguini]|uniref:Uncharacterized protein n=1 Tax=Helicobacter saguini TaxID=1548018 RepID=A0A347W3L6_9HELI|nr:hypothetical protein [Helicobacter saguini]MWV62191.1 hypothetical protein [Helicobacter saguini]MWV67135.1 hypothetical protein [Helicobacter saguini]MWV69487.1 hypothetical protein [Helicobacter saguini]MWV70961.1 hypothetical protein [Helicobacter saguini]TLD92951.1 hypothetical protein LS64_009695 [Helicobacter saguini]
MICNFFAIFLRSQNIDSIISTIYFSRINLKREIENARYKNSTQTLQVFLDSKVLTILNYSILESSLNIKLESKSKKAKKILQKQIDCHEAKASRNDNEASYSKSNNDDKASYANTRNDKIDSIKINYSYEDFIDVCELCKKII